VEEFGRVCEVQSDKATIEITSPYAGEWGCAACRVQVEVCWLASDWMAGQVGGTLGCRAKQEQARGWLGQLCCKSKARPFALRRSSCPPALSSRCTFLPYLSASLPFHLPACCFAPLLGPPLPACLPAGVVKKLHHKAGDVVQVGRLCVLRWPRWAGCACSSANRCKPRLSCCWRCPPTQVS